MQYLFAYTFVFIASFLDIYLFWLENHSLISGRILYLIYEMYRTSLYIQNCVTLYEGFEIIKFHDFFLIVIKFYQIISSVLVVFDWYPSFR